MSPQLKNEPKLDSRALAEWPPLAHLIRKDQQPAKEGDIALCGAKLMGLDLPNAKKLCGKCIKITHSR